MLVIVLDSTLKGDTTQFIELKFEHKIEEIKVTTVRLTTFMNQHAYDLLLYWFNYNSLSLKTTQLLSNTKPNTVNH